VFRMFSKMSGKRVTAESDGAVPLDEILAKGVRANADVSATAALDRRKLAVMAWHYFDDDVSGPEASINLVLQHLPITTGTAKVTEYRIDEEHSNAFTAWQRMGSPQQPTAEQYADLERAGQLGSIAAYRTPVAGGSVQLKTVLPRKGISLFVVTWTL
jgi:xylan 1,4-beta-xylosidase